MRHLFLLLPLTGGLAYAVEPSFEGAAKEEKPAEDSEEPEKPESDLMVELGGAVAGGNSSYWAVNGRANGMHKWKRNRVAAQAGANVGATVGRAVGSGGPNTYLRRSRSPSEYPRRGRGGAATRLRGRSASRGRGAAAIRPRRIRAGVGTPSRSWSQSRRCRRPRPPRSRRRSPRRGRTSRTCEVLFRGAFPRRRVAPAPWPRRGYSVEAATAV